MSRFVVSETSGYDIHGNAWREWEITVSDSADIYKVLWRRYVPERPLVDTEARLAATRRAARRHAALLEAEYA